MELPNNWEKKALIIVGAVFIISVIYALNPYQGTPTNDTNNQTSTQTINPIPFPKFTKTTSNNTSNNTNVTKLTAEQAKNIAQQLWPGYTAGDPIQGTINVNNTNYNVWIVPLSQQNVASKTIYIDATTGLIVLEK